jgi:hypothetical protein
LDLLVFASRDQRRRFIGLIQSVCPGVAVYRFRSQSDQSVPLRPYTWLGDGTALGLIPDRLGPQDLESAKARGLELEASAAARLNHFPGLPGNGGLRDVDDGRVTHTPKSAGVVRRLAAAAKSGQTAGPLDYSAGRSVSFPASGWTRRRPRTQNTRRPLSSLTVAQGAGEDLTPR